MQDELGMSCLNFLSCGLEKNTRAYKIKQIWQNKLLHLPVVGIWILMYYSFNSSLCFIFFITKYFREKAKKQQPQKNKSNIVHKTKHKIILMINANMTELRINISYYQYLELDLTLLQI